jgi:hypothetical protein
VSENIVKEIFRTKFNYLINYFKFKVKFYCFKCALSLNNKRLSANNTSVHTELYRETERQTKAHSQTTGSANRRSLTCARALRAFLPLKKIKCRKLLSFSLSLIFAT